MGRVSTPGDKLLTKEKPKPGEKFFLHSLPKGWSAGEVHTTGSRHSTGWAIHVLGYLPLLLASLFSLVTPVPGVLIP